MSKQFLKHGCLLTGELFLLFLGFSWCHVSSKIICLQTNLRQCKITFVFFLCCHIKLDGSHVSFLINYREAYDIFVLRSKLLIHIQKKHFSAFHVILIKATRKRSVCYCNTSASEFVTIRPPSPYFACDFIRMRTLH